MKRLLSAAAFCLILLGMLSWTLYSPVNAAENPLLVLLNLPAPPPPNPQVQVPALSRNRFDPFRKPVPPDDNAKIEDLIEYWRTVAQNNNPLAFRPEPSGKVLERLMDAIEKDPRLAPDLVNALPRNSQSAEFVKKIYDGSVGGGLSRQDRRGALKSWLKYNTDHFSSELARDAARVRDTEGYVVHHDELIALARVDWDRANPIVSRLYTNSGQRASQTAARWALYLHALRSDSPGDADRYRDELKATVEDKTLPAGIRDLALDALSVEKEWSGRDEWYLSMMHDETLLDLGTYTGLTTLISASPDDKYIDRMIALVQSENINVRTAAARNLVLKLGTDRMDVLKALLPWLSNPKWLKSNVGGRDAIIQTLGRVKMPESVPHLIAALNEKGAAGNDDLNYRVANVISSAANRAATAANTLSPAEQRRISNSAFNANINFNGSGYTGPEFPLRQGAIMALGFQEDPRAVQPLRRLFQELDQAYQYLPVVAAIYNCGGFAVTEQVDAIEHLAKNPEALPIASNSNVNAAGLAVVAAAQRPEIRDILASYLTRLSNVKDDLGRAVVDRIEALDKSDPKTATILRKLVFHWKSPAIHALNLRDIKNDRVDPAVVIELLTERRTLRETLPSEVSNLRTGGSFAIGLSACLLEDPNDYPAILDMPSEAAKTSLLACARLIRAPLPVAKVALNVQSKDPLLALAAERYLESEDSPEARRIVLSLHPNEAKVLGSTTGFMISGSDESGYMRVQQLFASIDPFHAQGAGYGYMGTYYESEFQENEKRLREEVQKDPDLLGVYNWQNNYIRIYKDRAMLSWHDDPARYRERALTTEEFDAFKGLLSHYKADELPPFLECYPCQPYQLLMLGRNGGRRVYLKASALPPFFSELNRTFEEFRLTPATIKYWAAKNIPGLEVLFADERFDAKQVWKNGSDIRLLVADKTKRSQIDKEIVDLAEATDDDDADGAEGEDVDDLVTRTRTLPTRKGRGGSTKILVGLV